MRPALLAIVILGVPQSSRAAFIVYEAFLSGPAESPPNASPGTGFTEVDFDTLAHTMRVRVTFSGLLGTTTASHIHATTDEPFTGTAMVATQVPTFSNFPLGVTSGTYDQTFNTLQDSFYNPAFEAANGGTAASSEAALAAALASGKSYLNIHTTVVPGGEIRGFLVAVSEPSSLALSCIGGVGLVVARAWRKRA
jgi:hypothetical protein